MKTFVVNLDKDTARWEYVSRALDAAQLEFERMPGIYGRALTSTEKAKHYDPATARWRQARELTAAEIGCALSHLRIYREISKRDLPRALVLEDDIALDADVAELLDLIEPHMPANRARVCLLSPAEGEDEALGQSLSETRELRPYGQGYYTSAYILTRAAAELLLGDLHPVGDVADCWKRLSKRSDLEIMIIAPAAIHQQQEEFGSSTTDDIKAALGGSPLARLRYKLLRLRNIILAPLIEWQWKRRARPVSATTSHPIDALNG